VYHVLEDATDAGVAAERPELPLADPAELAAHAGRAVRRTLFRREAQAAGGGDRLEERPRIVTALAVVLVETLGERDALIHLGLQRYGIDGGIVLASGGEDGVEDVGVVFGASGVALGGGLGDKPDASGVRSGLDGRPTADRSTCLNATDGNTPLFTSSRACAICSGVSIGLLPRLSLRRDRPPAQFVRR
jgi:hypothetical protein